MTQGRGPHDLLFVLSSSDRRGAQVEALGIALCLRTRGWTVEVVALSPSRSGQPIDVEVLGPRPLHVSTLRLLRERARGAQLTIAFGSTTLPASAIALVGSSPFVYRSIGDPAAWVRNAAHRSRTRLLMRRARHVVALWEGAADSLRRLYAIPPSAVSIIPNGRDSRRFRPPTTEQRRAARARLGVASEEPVVAMVCALTAEKEVGVAIEASALVAGLRLVIAGDGPERARLEGAARARGARVTFLGVVDDVVPLLHAADALLLTSRTEGMPGAVLEALLCGLPVVAPDVGAMVEIVDGSNGRLVPSSANAESYAAAITSVVTGRFSTPESVRATVIERFDTGAVERQWTALIERLTGG